MIHGRMNKQYIKGKKKKVLFRLEREARRRRKTGISSVYAIIPFYSLHS